MFNPRAAVGNGSRLSCHNIPKKIAAAPFQCSVWLRNGVKTLNVRVRQLRRSETGCTTSGGRWYCTDRSGAKIRSRERVRVRKQKKHIIDVLFKKKSARRDSNPRPRPWQGRAPPTEPLAHITTTSDIISLVTLNVNCFLTFFYLFIFSIFSCFSNYILSKVLLMF